MILALNMPEKNRSSNRFTFSRMFWFEEQMWKDWPPLWGVYMLWHWEIGQCCVLLVLWCSQRQNNSYRCFNGHYTLQRACHWALLGQKKYSRAHRCCMIMAVNPPDETKKGRVKRQNRKWIPCRLVLIRLQVGNAADVSLWTFNPCETWLLNTKSERPFGSWVKFDHTLTHHVWPQLFSCSYGRRLSIRFRELFKQSFFHSSHLCVNTEQECRVKGCFGASPEPTCWNLPSDSGGRVVIMAHKPRAPSVASQSFCPASHTQIQLGQTSTTRW